MSSGLSKRWVGACLRAVEAGPIDPAETKGQNNMTGSTKSSFWLVMGMVGALVGGLLVGCSSSPQERYRVLSYFFDGVPDPNAPKQKAVTEDEEQGSGGGLAALERVSGIGPETSRSESRKL